MRTRIKFCGLTRPEDLDQAVALGVDAIGLIFAERSKRRVDLATARALRRRLPPFVSAVALVMDAAITQVREILQVVRPDLLQFHGSETDADCAAFGLPWLRAIAMGEGADPLAQVARHPNAAGYVFDAHAPGAAGGSGRRFDWTTLPNDVARPLVLAGGLDPDNVGDAVRAVRPYAVDVASGIESAPGIKCPAKMAAFVAAVRAADAASL